MLLKNTSGSSGRRLALLGCILAGSKNWLDDLRRATVNLHSATYSTMGLELMIVDQFEPRSE